MEEILKEFVRALVSKADLPTLALLFCVVLLSFLLLKALGRVDAMSRDLAKNSQTLARLTELLNQLIYGRNRNGD
jgi:cell division protein FtsB